MNADCAPCSVTWPCSIETKETGAFVRDGSGRLVPLPAFQDACRDRAAALQRQARDAALRDAGRWLRRGFARAARALAPAPAPAAP